MFTSVRTPRVYEHIVGQIEQAIFEGRLAAGDRLPPERELVRQFHASRVAVREALRTLEHRGLVEVRHGSSGGHFVREVDAGLVRRDFATLFRLGRVSPGQLGEARLLVEPAIAGVATQRAGDVDVKALGDALEARERLVAAGGDPRVLDVRFHRQVAATAKNPVHAILVEALTDLEVEIQPRGALSADDHAAIGAAHRAIAAAIAARDAHRARTAMEAHILDLQQRLRRPEASAPVTP
jgi:DNA-binding FadR family transcriptional regulator